MLTVNVSDPLAAAVSAICGAQGRYARRGAHLFDRPDTNARVLLQLPAKTRVHLLRSQPPFAEVELGYKGRTIRGYMLQMRMSLALD